MRPTADNHRRHAASVTITDAILQQRELVAREQEKLRMMETQQRDCQFKLLKLNAQQLADLQMLLGFRASITEWLLRRGIPCPTLAESAWAIISQL
jgi:hypothetical protein